MGDRLGSHPRVRRRKHCRRRGVGRLLRVVHERVRRDIPGMADARLQGGDVERRSGRAGTARDGPANRRHSDPPQYSGVRDRHARDLGAAARRQRERSREQHHGRREAARARAVRRRRRDSHRHGQLHPVRAERLDRHPSGRGHRLLRLHRLRRDLHGSRGDEESAAKSPDRHPRRTRHLHAHLRRSSALSRQGSCRTWNCALPIRSRRHWTSRG